MVHTAIEEYLKPFLIGKDPQRIEDIWQTGRVNTYWRNGPVLNNAFSGDNAVPGAYFDPDMYARSVPGCYQSATLIAMGELFVHPREWMPLISQGLIDFIRCHVSAIGGITPAKKLAHICEAYSIRTAWHGPGDVSPVGHAANLHLGISMSNFGIQEWYGPTDKLREVFPGAPEVRKGYMYPNDLPGLGVDINEEQAAKYPCKNENPAWTLARLPDGTSARP